MLFLPAVALSSSISLWCIGSAVVTCSSLSFQYKSVVHWLKPDFYCYFTNWSCLGFFELKPYITVSLYLEFCRCINEQGSFTCNCTEHFRGPRCEETIKCEDRNPCENGATCIGKGIYSTTLYFKILLNIIRSCFSNPDKN